MKQLILLTALMWAGLSIRAQVVNDSVSLGAGYASQSYYKLSSGEVALVDNTNWDLAFDVSGFGSAIRYNAQNGVELYSYPSGDSSAWATLDTAGIAAWTLLQDADTSWALGAFNRNADPGDPFDLGWGIYNSTTHIVTGDSIYVVKLTGGSWKKLRILKLANGSYHFRYADLDGSNEVNASIAKSGYPGKNFAYYSLANGSALDREPNSGDWDLVFTRYVTELAPGVWYGVTGVLQNYSRPVAKAHPVANPATYTAYSSHPFSDQVNTIGYDWKTFNNQTFQYELGDSLCYFIEDVGNNIWRVVFTGFTGSSSGKITFEKELVAAVNVDPAGAITAFGLYPNPARDEVQLLSDLRVRSAEVTFRDLSGRIVRQETVRGNGFHRQSIDLGGFIPGIYLVTLQAGSETSHRKLIVR